MRHGSMAESDERNEQGPGGDVADEERRRMASRAVRINLGEAFSEERPKINNLP